MPSTPTQTAPVAVRPYSAGECPVIPPTAELQTLTTPWPCTRTAVPPQLRSAHKLNTQPASLPTLPRPSIASVGSRAVSVFWTIVTCSILPLLGGPIIHAPHNLTTTPLHAASRFFTRTVVPSIPSFCPMTSARAISANCAARIVSSTCPLIKAFVGRAYVMNYAYSGVNWMYIFVHTRNILKIKRAVVFICEQHAHNLRTRKRVKCRYPRRNSQTCVLACVGLRVRERTCTHACMIRARAPTTEVKILTTDDS